MNFPVVTTLKVKLLEDFSSSPSLPFLVPRARGRCRCRRERGAAGDWKELLFFSKELADGLVDIKMDWNCSKSQGRGLFRNASIGIYKPRSRSSWEYLFSLLSSSAFLFSLPRIEYNFISMVHHQETIMNERAWMPKGKQITLPSFHSLCKPIEELTTPPPAKETRNHYRTTSVPSRLPSQFQQRLSMDVLLDAIELEQSMYEQYKHERVKSMLREHHQHVHRFHPYDRRRSKSAPGGSVSIQCTKQAQWTSSFTNDQGLNPQQLAESIAQKHIDWAKRK